MSDLDLECIRAEKSTNPERRAVKKRIPHVDQKAGTRYLARRWRSRQDRAKRRTYHKRPAGASEEITKLSLRTDLHKLGPEADEKNLPLGQRAESQQTQYVPQAPGGRGTQKVNSRRNEKLRFTVEMKNQRSKNNKTTTMENVNASTGEKGIRVNQKRHAWIRNATAGIETQPSVLL